MHFHGVTLFDTIGIEKQSVVKRFGSDHAFGGIDLFNQLKNITQSKVFGQLIRYLVTGFTAFGIEYGLYVILIRFLNIHYIWASVVVYFLVFWFVFFVNRFWSFKSTSDIKRQLLQYGLLFAFNLIVANVFLMAFLTETLGLSQYLSPMIKMAFVVCWNFLFYKYVIYK